MIMIGFSKDRITGPGPDLEKFKGGACSAIIKDDGEYKTVAVLGGWNEFESYFGEMEVFQCRVGGTKTPVCKKGADGPPLIRGRSGIKCRNCEYGCGVLETASNNKILLAMKWGKFPTEVLDLSLPQRAWKWQQCE